MHGGGCGKKFCTRTRGGSLASRSRLGRGGQGFPLRGMLIFGMQNTAGAGSWVEQRGGAGGVTARREGSSPPALYLSNFGGCRRQAGGLPMLDCISHSARAP